MASVDAFRHTTTIRLVGGTSKNIYRKGSILTLSCDSQINYHVGATRNVVPWLWLNAKREIDGLEILSNYNRINSTSNPRSKTVALQRTRNRT
jgi:hypothetical protein